MRTPLPRRSPLLTRQLCTLACCALAAAATAQRPAEAHYKGDVSGDEIVSEDDLKLGTSWQYAKQAVSDASVIGGGAPTAPPNAKQDKLIAELPYHPDLSAQAVRLLPDELVQRYEAYDWAADARRQRPAVASGRRPDDLR